MTDATYVITVRGVADPWLRAALDDMAVSTAATRRRAAILIVVVPAAQADRAAVATVTADSRGTFLSPAAHGISDFVTSR